MAHLAWPFWVQGPPSTSLRDPVTWSSQKLVMIFITDVGKCTPEHSCPQSLPFHCTFLNMCSFALRCIDPGELLLLVIRPSHTRVQRMTAECHWDSQRQFFFWFSVLYHVLLTRIESHASFQINIYYGEFYNSVLFELIAKLISTKAN